MYVYELRIIDEYYEFVVFATLFVDSYTAYHTNATDATLSPSSLNLIPRPPWVARPWIEIARNGVRKTCPFFEITIRSRSSFEFEINAPTTGPVFGVTFAVFTPDPPQIGS